MVEKSLATWKIVPDRNFFMGNGPSNLIFHAFFLHKFSVVNKNMQSEILFSKTT